MADHIPYSIENLLGYYEKPTPWRKKRLVHAKESILKGESTGDRVNDLVIHESFDEGSAKGLEKYFRNLQQQVHENQGLPVLYVAHKEHRWHEGGCFGGGGGSAEVKDARLGIIRGELDFIFKESYMMGDVVIPTKNYLHKDATFFENTPFAKVEGKLTIPMREIVDAVWGVDNYKPDFTEPMGMMCGGGISTQSLRRTEFFFNEAAEYIIVAGILSPDQSIALHKGYNMLSSMLNEWQKREKFNGDYKLYASFLEMLGEQSPDEVKVKVQQQVNWEKEAIVAELQNLITKRDSRQDGRLKEILAKAMKMGLHQEEIKLRIGPGTTLDLADAIKELSRELKVLP